MKKIALIFAGGSGQRMGSDIPKQFLKVNDKEIIIHTMELFENCKDIDEIYIACIESHIEFLKELINKYKINKVKRIFKGGTSGQESIFISLTEAKKDNDNAIVLIHDGVRPLVTEDTIIKCIKGVEEHGTAITSTVSFETPIYSKNGKMVEEMPDRNMVYTAQAPQGFYLDQIYNMHIKERKNNLEYKGIVDSCALMFKNGVKCHLIEGNRGNIKVTTKEDYYTLMGNLNAENYKKEGID